MRLKKWTKAALLAAATCMLAVFTLTTFTACSDGSDGSGDEEKAKVVVKYVSENEDTVMTFYDDNSFTLEEDSPSKSARALTVTVRGTYEGGNPTKAGDVVICISEDGKTRIEVTVKANGSIEFIVGSKTYVLTKGESTPSTPDTPDTPTPPAQSSYKVTFKYKTLTGDETKEEEVDAGKTVDATKVPTVTPIGKLANWYVVWVDDDKKVFKLNTPITKNITLTAEERDSKYLIVQNGNEVIGCNEPEFPADGNIEIPEGITKLKESFHLNTSVKGVTIADTVTEIGTKTFYGCKSLTSVEIPGSVRSIGEGAFSGCTSLATITLNEGLTTIGNTAFENCAALTALTIPDSVTSIGTSAFSGCTLLKKVDIGDGVTSIRAGAFTGCTSLEEVVIGDGVTSIADSMFKGNESLRTVSLGKGVQAIGASAFEGCTSLTEVEFHGGVIKGIGRFAFYNHSLERLEIPGSVKSIGQDAFYGGSKGTLKSVKIDGDVGAIDIEAFVGNNALETVEITGNVESIGQWVFNGCTSLEELVIGGDVGSIHQLAFLRNLKVSINGTEYNTVSELLEHFKQ